MIGDKIRKLRKEKSLTLKSFGERINMSPSFLSDIENNRTQPSLSRLQDIAKELDVSICELLDESCQIHGNKNRNLYIAEKDIFEELAGDEYSEIRNELRNIKKWSEEDRNDLVAYLKAKRLARESVKSEHSEK